MATYRWPPLGADVYAAMLGRCRAPHQPVAVASEREPSPGTPEELADLQAKLRIAQ